MEARNITVEIMAHREREEGKVWQLKSTEKCEMAVGASDMRYHARGNRFLCSIT